MNLVVSRIAILAVSCIVPRDVRVDWRRGWIAEIRHYAALLRARGVKNRYVRARIGHHLKGAMRDAWRLLSETPGMRWLNSTLRTPGFCLGVIALGLVAIVVASRGLAITRAMLSPPYPAGERLVLISEGGAIPNTRHPIEPALFDFWKTRNTTFAGIAGYQWNSHGTAWITPEFVDVVGSEPRRFLLHRVRDWKPITNRRDLALIGRLKPGVSVEAAQTELRDLAVLYRQAVSLPV